MKLMIIVIVVLWISVFCNAIAEHVKVYNSTYMLALLITICAIIAFAKEMNPVTRGIFSIVSSIFFLLYFYKCNKGESSIIYKIETKTWKEEKTEMPKIVLYLICCLMIIFGVMLLILR